jgi:pimeloyl-ACP methyl ester carboxylesterase
LSAAPILLLHGQPGRARDWDRVRAAMGERESAIAVDRPGWDGRRRPAGIARNAVAALEALDRAGAERATVVGHSFGGAVAAWLAAARPERVARLVLVAPAANVASLYAVDYLLAAPVAGYALGIATLGAMGVALRSFTVRRLIQRQLALEERFLRLASATLLSPSSWRAFFVEQQALVRELPALESRLGQITAPTTIVAGTADWIVPLSSLRKLAAQIPGSQLTVLRRAGHLLAQERAEEVAEAIAGRVPLG